MRTLVRADTPFSALVATSSNVVFDLSRLSGLAIQAVYSNGTTSAKTFTTVSTTLDTATITAHGQVTGSVGQLTTSGGLPAGLATTTNYFLIIVDANTVKFASSLANAVAGTAIDLTTAGTGTQTFTPTTSGSNVLKLQSSCDLINWADISGMTVTIATSAGVTVWDLATIAYSFPNFAYVRALYTPSAGQINLALMVNGWNN